MRRPGLTLLVFVVALLTFHDATMAATGHASSVPMAIDLHAAHSEAADEGVSEDCGMVRLMGRASTSPGDPSSADQFRQLPADPTSMVTRAISASLLQSPMIHPPTNCRAFFQVYRI